MTYNLLRAWKGEDSSFPFIDSHDKNYNVRDGSDWENTLKPRLRERIRNSKNIVLVLSDITRNSRALREEIDYGINDQGLPVIVIYPDFDSKGDIADSNGIRRQVRDLAGPMSFALFMGTARALYGKYGERVRLEFAMLGSGVLCIASYLIISLVPNPVVGLLGLGLCGFSVGILWPGTFSMASASIPKGGTALFALLALKVVRYRKRMW